MTVLRLADRCIRVALLLAWMAVIFYWSTQSTLPIDQPAIASMLRGTQHRVAHVLAFGLLGLLARWAFDGVPRAGWWAILLASLFGATDEWHQSFTMGRRPGIDDWAVDTGAAAGMVSLWSALCTTPLRYPIRVLAPMMVAAVFVVSVGLAFRPGVILPSDISRPSLRAMTSQVGSTAVDVARSTRNLARHVRSVLS